MCRRAHLAIAEHREVDNDTINIVVHICCKNIVLQILLVHLAQLKFEPTASHRKKKKLTFSPTQNARKPSRKQLTFAYKSSLSNSHTSSQPGHYLPKTPPTAAPYQTSAASSSPPGGVCPRQSRRRRPCTWPGPGRWVRQSQGCCHSFWRESRNMSRRYFGWC